MIRHILEVRVEELSIEGGRIVVLTCPKTIFCVEGTSFRLSESDRINLDAYVMYSVSRITLYDRNAGTYAEIRKRRFNRDTFRVAVNGLQDNHPL